MSTPMMLGTYAFEALGFGMDTLSRRMETRWEEMPVAGTMNPIQFTGGDGEYVQISGVLFPLEFGGQDSLEGIRSAAMAGTIMRLVALNGSVYGQFVVEGVDEEQTYMDANGNARQNTYSLSLRRYFGNGLTPQ